MGRSGDWAGHIHTNTQISGGGAVPCVPPPGILAMPLTTCQHNGERDELQHTSTNAVNDQFLSLHSPTTTSYYG